MPNPIKYTTGSESDALVKGNFRIGTGSVGKGPSDTTGFYQGPNVPSGGYVIYMNKDGAPGNLSYHSAANDAELISFTNSLAGQSYTTVNECFNYYYGQTDKVLVNQDYPADYPYIVMDGLVLNLDAGITQSYPGSGTVWTDVNGLGPKNNGTLTNGPTFSTDGGGSIVFDGVDDYVNVSDIVPLYNTDWTIECWALSTGGKTIWPTLVMQLNDSPQHLQFATCHTGAGRTRVLAFWYWYGAVYGTTSIPYNTWHNATIQYRHSDGYIKFFLNGVSDSNWLGPITKYTSLATEMNIGTWTATSSQRLAGDISSVRIYTKLLSDSEILQNYNATKGRFGL